MENLNNDEILRCERCGEVYNDYQEYDFIICPICKYIKEIENDNY